jgi:hypothetical protein
MRPLPLESAAEAWWWLANHLSAAMQFHVASNPRSLSEGLEHLYLRRGATTPQQDPDLACEPSVLGRAVAVQIAWPLSPSLREVGGCRLE